MRGAIVAGEDHTLYVASSSGVYEINTLDTSVTFIKDDNQQYLYRSKSRSLI